MGHKKLDKTHLEQHFMNLANPVDNVTLRLQHDLQMLKDTIRSTVVSLFDWEVPFICLPQYIESLLFNKGRCCFFMFEKAVICTPFDYVADYNVMGQPLYVNCFLYNNKTVRNKITDVVIMQNRDFELPGRVILEQYASRLQDLNQALDNNLLHTNHPFLIKSWGKNNNLTRFFDKIVSGIPVISISENIKNNNDIDVLNTNVDYLGSEILNTYINLRNEMLINFGIPANMTNKTERVTTAETHNDTCLCDLIFNNMLDNRQKAVNKINDMFGIGVNMINNREKVISQLNKVGDVNVETKSNR